MANDDYLTPKQAAKLICFSYHTLLLLEDEGKGPPCDETEAVHTTWMISSLTKLTCQMT